ncbi:MAG: bifunctional methylenetetrahydrofolate dehydrogenase/methenyltetrahydrofolate cyclohydrolase, partial [Alcaligenaceae bacterium]|nr:bifunctional methylenetetrahydrofolate dehydrogenase/methenyltetrahydrofolate cyclohydrolase [Alcaligenaceae bacterium]
MTARIIDGKALSDTIKHDVALRVTELKSKGVTPGLAVVLVGEDPASTVYVRNKAAACEKAGLHSEVIRLPADITETALLDVVKGLNVKPAIHGILVQLPLPAHLDAAKVIETIAAEKDVDGFHISNA